MDDPAAATPPCPNCGMPRPGDWCPDCGQRQGTRLLSLRRLLQDALDDQLSLNSALPRTLRALLTRPGFLTAEYVQGRIARYIPPFRLYLATSILFFLVLTLVSLRQPGGALTITANGEPMGTSDRPVAVRTDRSTFYGVRVDSNLVPDTTIIFVNFGPRWASELAATRVRELSRMPPDEIAGALLPSMLERVPAGMFVLLPVFAGLLKLVLLDRRRLYVEHFVFALHTHAFTFLVLAVLIPFGLDPVNALAFVGILTYYIMAMRRFYGLGIAGTLLRGAVLLTLYNIILIMVLLGALALALLLG